ncbi:hypothetical protein NM688_g9054 [Phlebia brevispora]|uniref:Uncharacterized protein n=1 Tax=Phlebia brevispora TaxID=194682 RepID=A0ACC1RJW2_9APHY|nr:hypothetical protein NM688_g9054 [Phlebia brevispora]
MAQTLRSRSPHGIIMFSLASGIPRDPRRQHVQVCHKSGKISVSRTREQYGVSQQVEVQVRIQDWRFKPAELSEPLPPRLSMDPLLQSAIQHTLDDQEWEDDGEEEYDNEEDLDAEAEEIAKRLGDQLLADIAKAQAEAANAAQAVVTQGATELQPAPTAAVSEPTHLAETSDQSKILPHNRKQEAALMTVRTILSFAFKDPVVRATLNTYIVHNSENRSVLDVLTQCASSNTIDKDLARPLSNAVPYSWTRASGNETLRMTTPLTSGIRRK